MLSGIKSAVFDFHSPLVAGSLLNYFHLDL
jgi:hypothetical protein